MKKALLVMTIGLVAIGAGWAEGTAMSAHDPGEDEASVALGKGKGTINYGTTKRAGRTLTEMIKPGLPWFMGMNNPTTLETTVALDFNGKTLQPGKYAIFSRSDEQRNWTLLVSSAIVRPLKT